MIMERRFPYSCPGGHESTPMKQSENGLASLVQQGDGRSLTAALLRYRQVRTVLAAAARNGTFHPPGLALG